MKKLSAVILNIIPILLMIGLIPLVADDYALTLIYIAIITISLTIKRTPNDFVMLILGFFTMLIAEYLFVSTGVEIFLRNTLLGLMPLWLPFLWAYGFIAIKRSIEILTNN
ncbi:MAG: hypothetical protein Q7K65_05350 [Candidatus Buchananbacteria bacterium]|nr:hypothetical protein [Candidatus Buchananbacteria bacterium]